MKYRVGIRCYDQIVGYWCDGAGNWTTDPDRAKVFGDRAAAQAQVAVIAHWINRDNIEIEEIR